MLQAALNVAGLRLYKQQRLKHLVICLEIGDQGGLILKSNSFRCSSKAWNPEGNPKTPWHNIRAVNPTLLEKFDCRAQSDRRRGIIGNPDERPGYLIGLLDKITHNCHSYRQ